VSHALVERDAFAMAKCEAREPWPWPSFPGEDDGSGRNLSEAARRFRSRTCEDDELDGRELRFRVELSPHVGTFTAVLERNVR
jgi:hypothetical protein